MIHGVRTVPEVVVTAEPLVAQLAGSLVSQAVTGVATGEDLIETLEEVRAKARKQLWRLDQHDGPVIDVPYGTDQDHGPNRLNAPESPTRVSCLVWFGVGGRGGGLRRSSGQRCRLPSGCRGRAWAAG